MGCVGRHNRVALSLALSLVLNFFFLAHEEDLCTDVSDSHRLYKRCDVQVEGVPVAHLVVEVVLALLLIYISLFRRRSRSAHGSEALSSQVGQRAAVFGSERP